MSTLSTERCIACRRDSPRVTDSEIAELRREVSAWQVLERDGIARLERVFDFPNFVDALAFTNRVGALAETEGHHPALLTEWGRVTVNWWTHKIRPPSERLHYGREDRCAGHLERTPRLRWVLGRSRTDGRLHTTTRVPVHSQPLTRRRRKSDR